MKQILIILALIVAATIANGQTATFDIPSKTLREVTNNYTLTNEVAAWFQFTALKDNPSTQNYQCKLKHATGTHTAVAVSLYGRMFSDDSWTQIGSTQTWSPGVNDSTLTISNPVYNRYREYKVNFAGTGTGTTTIDNQIFKIWLH